jgi:alpha-1,2-mannosyltransferase
LDKPLRIPRVPVVTGDPGLPGSRRTTVYDRYLMAPASAPQVPASPTNDFQAKWSPVLWGVGIVSTAWATTGAVELATRRQLDIAVYLMGGRNLVDDRLYQMALSQPPHLPFTYPPFAALVFAPLSGLPQRWAQVIWALVNVVALFALVALALRAARRALGRQRLVMWSLVLMAPAYWLEPVHLTLSFGQVNIVLAAMVLGDLTCRLRVGNRTLPQGVLVGIAASIKLVPLVFVPYLFLTRQTRAAWVSLGTFVVCSAVTAATDPRVSWSYWTKYAFDAKRVGGVFYISNQSLRAVADRLDHRVVSTGLITLAGAVVVVAGVLLAAWAYRSSSSYIGILVCATTGLLASPITWAHHMVWVVPVLIWLVLAPDRPRGGLLWAVAGYALFWWAPIWRVPNGGNNELHEHGWQLLEGNSFFLAAVVFMVGVAVMLWKRQRIDATGVAAPPGVEPDVTGASPVSRTATGSC